MQQDIKDLLRAFEKRLNSLEGVMKGMEEKTKHLLPIRARLESLDRVPISNLFWKILTGLQFLVIMFLFVHSHFNQEYMFSKICGSIQNTLHKAQSSVIEGAKPITEKAKDLFEAAKKLARR